MNTYDYTQTPVLHTKATRNRLFTNLNSNFVTMMAHIAEFMNGYRNLSAEDKCLFHKIAIPKYTHVDYNHKSSHAYVTLQLLQMFVNIFANTINLIDLYCMKYDQFTRECIYEAILTENVNITDPSYRNTTINNIKDELRREMYKSILCDL